MRLAQRSYRSRKDNELATTKARADVLQRALNSSLDEFIKFHELSSGREKDLPSEFMLQLNRTAMNIMAIARSAQTDEWPADGQTDRFLSAIHGSKPDDHKADDTIYIVTQGAADNGSSSSCIRPKPVTISQRLIRACVDRAADILNLRSSPIMCLLPAMLLPLQFDRRDNLISRTMRYLSIEDTELILDHEHSPIATRHLPSMLRLVEGQSSSLVPRKAPPNLQRLQFGRTRTVLSTAIPDLQGEWLEASDVEEYLEQRGIFIRQESPDADMLNLAIPVENGLAAQTTDLNEANFHNPVRLITNEPHHPIDPSLVAPYEIQQTTADQYTVNPDYTVFGQQRDVQVLPTGMKMFTPTAWSVDNTDILPTNVAVHNPSDHISIMINLDNLIVGLAAKAVCLGPCPGIRRADVDAAIRDSVVQMPQLRT